VQRRQAHLGRRVAQEHQIPVEQVRLADLREQVQPADAPSRLQGLQQGQRLVLARIGR